MAPVEKVAEASVELPAGWYAVIDEESGETYYQNEEGESSWEVPAAA